MESSYKKRQPKTPQVKVSHKLCQDCVDVLPKEQAKLQAVSFYCEEHAAARGIEAEKVRVKIAKPPKQRDPEADDANGEPPRESPQWRLWSYGKAYADGMTQATGHPFTRPLVAVAGPNDVLLRALQAHCKDETGKQLRGPLALEWIKDVVAEFRAKASERDYGFGQLAWSPVAFARWLDNGRPTMALSRPSAAAARAHISVKQG